MENEEQKRSHRDINPSVGFSEVKDSHKTINRRPEAERKE
jgi:hypothetical protein